MEMIPVESSNIASIGYENEVLRVRFRDGAEYDYDSVTPARHAELMASDSKGKWLNEFIFKRSGQKIKREMLAREPDAAKQGPTHTSRAEGCCIREINKASLSGVLDKMQPWECPKCGTRYEAKAFGSLVYWEAQADILVFKL